MLGRLLVVAGLLVPVAPMVGTWPARTTGARPKQSVAPSYTITDIGSGQTNHSWALGINGAGHVVGAEVLPDGEHAFLYDGGTLHDLAPADGITPTVGQSINDADHVALIGSLMDGTNSAFLDDGSAIHAIGDLGGGFSRAQYINNEDRVAGYSYLNDNIYHAFFYDGSIHDLGTLGGLDSIAYGVNDRDHVVGWSYVSGDNTNNHAFFDDGAMHELPITGSLYSTANAINNVDHVVGDFASTQGTEHAFFYDGTFHDLGMFQGGDTTASAINNSDQIIGSGGAGYSRPFLYESGVMRDLNDLIVADSGWVLQQAWGINDVGQITGDGTHNGASRAFLLTPISPTVTATPTATAPPTATGTPSPSPTSAIQSVTLTFSTGWNLVAFPLVPVAPLSAYDVLSAVTQSSTGSFAELASWNGLGWITAIDNGGNLQGSDLPITQTQGYFLYTNAPATYVLGGQSAGG